MVTDCATDSGSCHDFQTSLTAAPGGSRSRDYSYAHIDCYHDCRRQRGTCSGRGGSTCHGWRNPGPGHDPVSASGAIHVRRSGNGNASGTGSISGGRQRGCCDCFLCYDPPCRWNSSPVASTWSCCYCLPSSHSPPPYPDCCRRKSLHCWHYCWTAARCRFHDYCSMSLLPTRPPSAILWRVYFRAGAA